MKLAGSCGQIANYLSHISANLENYENNDNNYEVMAI